MDGKSFKESLQEQKETVLRLKGKERLDYLKTYYLKGVLLVILVLACLAFFLLDVRESTRPLALSGLVVNVSVSEEGRSLLTEGFLETTGDSSGRIFLGEETLLMDSTQLQLDEYRKIMAIGSQVAGGEIDFLLLDGLALESLLEAGIFVDPGECLSEAEDGEEILSLLEEVMQWQGEEADAFRVLCLQDTPMAKMFAATDGKLYLGITTLPERYGQGRDLLYYLLEKGCFSEG